MMYGSASTKGVVWALAIALGAVGTANAITTYTDPAAFNAAAGVTTLYDFDSDGGTDIKSSPHDFGDFSLAAPLLYSAKVEPQFPGSTNQVVRFNTSSYTQNVTATFDQPLYAFGFTWANEDNNDDVLRFRLYGTDYVLGVKGETGFWGFTTDGAPLPAGTALQWGDTYGGSGWLLAFIDDFRYATSAPNTGGPTVPVPGALLLALTGVGALARVRRRHG